MHGRRPLLCFSPGLATGTRSRINLSQLMQANGREQIQDGRLPEVVRKPSTAPVASIHNIRLFVKHHQHVFSLGGHWNSSANESSTSLLPATLVIKTIRYLVVMPGGSWLFSFTPICHAHRMCCSSVRCSPCRRQRTSRLHLKLGRQLQTHTWSPWNTDGKQKKCSDALTEKCRANCVPAKCSQTEWFNILR